MSKERQWRKTGGTCGATYISSQLVYLFLLYTMVLEMVACGKLQAMNIDP